VVPNCGILTEFVKLIEQHRQEITENQRPIGKLE